MSSPVLSIIVPVYNVGPYLGRCVKSILSQTFKDFELILIDDGSTDISGELCEQLKLMDHRILVVHQLNRGQAAARNQGIAIAKGEWLGFVDSDDWLEPNMYEKLLDAVSFYKAEVAICRHQFVSSSGSFQVIGEEINQVMDNIEATRQILGDERIQSFAWNKIYARRLFQDILYPEGRIFEDTATTYKLLYKAKSTVKISYVGYNYFANPQGTLLGASLNVDKWTKNFIDNSLAFSERYLFARSHKEFQDIVPLCAKKAYLMVQGFLHACGKNSIKLNYKQKLVVESILRDLCMKDLSDVPMIIKMDLCLFKMKPGFMWAFLKILKFR